MVAQVFCFDMMDILGEKVNQITSSSCLSLWNYIELCEMRSKWERLLLEREKEKKKKKQEIKVYFEKLHGSDQWRVDHETLSLVFGNNSALIQVRITWVIHPELMIQVKAH